VKKVLLVCLLAVAGAFMPVLPPRDSLWSLWPGRCQTTLHQNLLLPGTGTGKQSFSDIKIPPRQNNPLRAKAKESLLSHKIAIYIPSTIHGNLPAPSALVSKRVTQAKMKFAKLFGGFTAYKAQGGWVSPVQGLVEEDVMIVQAFSNDAGLASVPAVKALAQEIAREMTQESVSVEVDGTLYFIHAKEDRKRTIDLPYRSSHFQNRDCDRVDDAITPQTAKADYLWGAEKPPWTGWVPAR
jgi:hypothetical protein